MKVTFMRVSSIKSEGERDIRGLEGLIAFIKAECKADSAIVQVEKDEITVWDYDGYFE